MMNILKSFNSTPADHGANKDPQRVGGSKNAKQTLKKRRRISWNVNNNDKLNKNRRIIDGHLRRVGHLAERPLLLNPDGMCYFPYKKFIIVVEVPEDDGGVVFLYTMCYQMQEGDNKSAVLLTAMELNYMQVGTRGATLGINEMNEVHLTFSIPIHQLSKDDFSSCLEGFMQTASEMNDCLNAARYKKRWSF